MYRAVLARLEASEQGTFGLLTVGSFRCYTVERPWLDNQANVSCVPVGTYRAVMTRSPRLKKNLYLLLEVPQRAGIRVHGANLAKQLNGCIAPGLKLGWIDNVKAVLLSSPALRQLEKLLDGQPFELEITNG